jgi:transcriptional regulator with XRE-family HTH domain
MTAQAKGNGRSKPAFPPRCNIRVLREKDGLSVAQLRDRIAEFGVDVSESHIRNVELGHQNLTSGLRAAWAKAVGIKYADLIVPDGNGDAG